MTVDLCTAACHTVGYNLAGVEYSQECCKSTLSPHCIFTHPAQGVEIPFRTVALLLLIYRDVACFATAMPLSFVVDQAS